MTAIVFATEFVGRRPPIRDHSFICDRSFRSLINQILYVLMGDPPEGSVADQLVSIHPTRGHCFLRHLRCGAPKTEELGAINLLAVPALKVRPRSVACLLRGIFGSKA